MFYFLDYFQNMVHIRDDQEKGNVCLLFPSGEVMAYSHLLCRHCGFFTFLILSLALSEKQEHCNQLCQLSFKAVWWRLEMFLPQEMKVRIEFEMTR